MIYILLTHKGSWVPWVFMGSDRPQEIDDPSDSKPTDWVDDAKMDDPEASKPVTGWVGHGTSEESPRKEKSRNRKRGNNMKELQIRGDT